MKDRRRDIALFRYALIREAADPKVSPRVRGELVRALASREHLGPDGEPVRVSRRTLDRWIRAWREGGFEALMPLGRARAPLTPAAVLELAERVKKEAPRRTAAQVREILLRAGERAPSERTLQRHFARQGLNRVGRAAAPRIYGRFEAEGRNELWTGDALHGPVIRSRKAYLFCFIDDWSRTLVGYRWGLAEDTLRLEAALRAGLSSRGVPQAVYVDNGSAFSSRWLLRACAVLGIRLVHSRPGEPAGRGKIERAFRTIREQFLVELEHRGGARDLAECNRLFSAWAETVYHRRVHSETGEAPLERFLREGPPSSPTPAELREAFLWTEWRQVAKTATVNLHGNVYEVDPALVGQKVELVFDPFAMADVEVRWGGRPMGKAMPHVTRRHVHPRARREEPEEPPPPSGIDYLGLVEAEYLEGMGRGIAYSELDRDNTFDGNDAGDTSGTHDYTEEDDR